jgi:hypothetical protein
MKRNYLFLLTSLFTILLSGCDWNDDEGLFSCIDGDGDTISEELQIDDFSKLKLRISGDVYITQGETQKVVVEGQQNVIHQLDLDVNDDTWEIEFDDCVDDHDGLKFYITMSEIRELNISGSGMIYGENEFNIDQLKLRISGSGDIDLALAESNAVDSKISGSGRIKLSGVTEDFTLKISGSGDYRAFDLDAQDGVVDISGSGDAEVTANDELRIKISGSGDVYYRGTPDLSIDISGSGDVIDAN